jgi:cytochrome c556
MNGARIGLTGTALIVMSGLAGAQTALPDKDGFIADITIAEIMESMVMPAAQVLWDAVGVDVTEKGEIQTKPETDEDWAKVRAAAITLAEAANTMIVSGRRAAPAGETPEEGSGELTPAEVEALIATQRPAWVGYANVLHASAIQALAAVDARDTDAISEVGGTIDEACEACHVQFWYPDQR